MSTFASLPFDEFLDQVAAKSPTPGGGAVASAVGALSAALASMVVNYSVGKKTLAEHEPRLRGALMNLSRGRDLLLALAEEDAEAYGIVNQLQKLPEGDPRRKDLPEALEAAVQAPLSTVAASVELLRLFDLLSGITNRHLRSDLAIAAVLADASARSSRWNVLVNAAALDESARGKASRQLNEMLSESSRLLAKIEAACA